MNIILKRASKVGKRRKGRRGRKGRKEKEVGAQHLEPKFFFPSGSRF